MEINAQCTELKSNAFYFALHCAVNAVDCSCVGNWKLENLADLPDLLLLLPTPILIPLIGEFAAPFLEILWKY